MEKDLQKVWKDTMTALSRSHPGVFGMMNAGRLAEASDDCFTWESKDPKNTFQAEYLQRTENHQMVEDALTLAAGRACRFIVRRPEQAVRKDRSAANLQMFRDTFGAENVLVQEE